jgi:4'-phosphopantetheinyl transferase
LLLIHSEGHIRMSAIATALGVKDATATGIVNNLVEKGLVTREEDPEDRRLVICALSSLGEATMSSMWALGQSKMHQMLQGLTAEQLKKAEEVARFLLANVISKSKHS